MQLHASLRRYFDFLNFLALNVRYGVRPSSMYSLGDQLGLVLSPKSKIEDGSTVGKVLAHRTAVADFRLRSPFELQLVPRIRTFSGPRPSLAEHAKVG